MCVCVGESWERAGEEARLLGEVSSSKKEQIIEVIGYTYYTSVSTSVVAKLTSNALDRDDITHKRCCKTSTRISFIKTLSVTKMLCLGLEMQTKDA